MDERETVDRDLMSRVAARDGVAFARLFEVHGPMTLGVLLRILGRRSEAEEVLQEVFLQVWMQADRYDEVRSTPRGWILMLARSRALDRLRRRDSLRRREEAAGLESSGEAIPPMGTERLETLERRHQVTSALGALSPDQRRCIELAFFEGLTHTQIAARLEAPLGTIKSRILLGMNKLRQALSADA
jgi:RNA polymerase sigma-70 factor (ECF subfamily)